MFRTLAPNQNNYLTLTVNFDNAGLLSRGIILGVDGESCHVTDGPHGRAAEPRRPEESRTDVDDGDQEKVEVESRAFHQLTLF
jgi:hypothetical protein